MVTTQMLVWVFFTAVMVSIVYAFAMQYTLSVLGKRLVDSGTNAADNAKTLDELGYKNSLTKPVTEFFARGGSAVARAVEKICAENDKEQDKELLFVQTEPTRYYLPEENISKSIKRHIYERTSPGKFAALLVILVVVAYIAAGVIDFLGNYAGNLIEGNDKNPVGVEGGSGSLLEEQEELNRREEEMAKIEAEIKASEEAAKKAEQEKEQTVSAENTAE